MGDVLSIRLWDDPILSTVCKKVEDNEFGTKLEEFCSDMITTMKLKNGLGLAAPQIGVEKRIFVMDAVNSEDKELVICNPKLVLTGRTVAGREGCLSLPGLYEQVYRSEGAVLQYQSPLGESNEIVWSPDSESSRMYARIVQHEVDHLEGILFFDYKDKRENYVTEEYPIPRGARMTKNMHKKLMRLWDKQSRKDNK